MHDCAPTIRSSWPSAPTKFVSPKLHGLVFTGSYFELLPEMWLAK